MTEKNETWSFTAGFVRSLARSLARQGVPPDPFLAKFDVHAETPPEQLVPLPPVQMEIERIAREKNNPTLPLELGRTMPVGMLGRVDVAWTASATLITAMMRTVNSITEFTNALRLELHVDDAAFARIAIVPLMPAYPDSIMTLTVAIVASRIRHVLGGEIDFSAVKLLGPTPPSSARYDAVFGVEVEFGATEGAVVFPVHYLQQELLTADPSLVEMLRAERTRPPPAMPEDDLLTKARARLRQSLEREEDPPTMVSLAKELGMATRSLQRKLGEHETSFSQLFDDVRREMAKTLLAEENVLLADVAQQLGFQNLNAFHRAFRRWTGASPRAFQKKTGATGN